MFITEGQIIGPWRVINILHKDKDRCISDVEIHNITEDILKTLDGNQHWVMKILYNNYEIKNILKYDLDKCKYSMKYPKESNYLSGSTSYFFWFVMESFDNDCSLIKSDTFNHIMFLECTINFLRYIHREKKIVHGDLKIKNILHNDYNRFAICDFEAIQEPDNTIMCNGSDHDHYYYYLHGCELNQPYFSYRNDLQNICFILWYIKLNMKYLPYQNNANHYYNKKERLNKLEELEKIRKLDIMPTFIQKFYDIITDVKWDQLEPPNDEIYDNLIKLSEVEF